MRSLNLSERLLLWKSLLLHSFIFAVIFLSAFSGAKAAEPWPTECKLQLAASLPFSINHGHIRIAVRVNDVQRAFIIDTGAFLSSVTQNVVESQGLKTHSINDNIAISGIGGQKADHYAIADTLTFGHLKANDVRLVVAPALGNEDGIIGPDYLRNFDLEFDFTNKTLNLFRPHPCSDHSVYWTDQYTSLPMDITPQGHIRVIAMLDGKELETIIDTGSPATLIGERTATSKLNVDSSTATLTLHGASGGSTAATVQHFHILQLGNVTIDDPSLLVTKDETAWRSDYSDLLIGLNELSKFHVYIAYRERKLYLSLATATR